MRLTTAVLAFSCPFVATAATLDLDVPGAMDALERSKPSHYARVVQLVSAAQRQPCRSEDFRRVQVALAAKDLDCSMIVKTSLPPRQRVTFELDGAVYSTTVVLHYATPDLIR
jgi:hypothetical protein